MSVMFQTARRCREGSGNVGVTWESSSECIPWYVRQLDNASSRFGSFAY